MEGVRATLPFILLAALAHQTIALKCNAGCVGTSGNAFNYQPGTSYKYELEGDSVMSMAGAEGDAAKMTVKASAVVAALPDCGFSVSLTNLQISDKEGKSVAGEKGQPVVFSMNNGVVTSDICTSKDEPMDALNVKRAIISLLQSSSHSDTRNEVDVFGSCPTDIHVHKHGPKLKVKKTKNLSNCAHRQNLMIPFTTTHYHSISDIQSIPWSSATQKIEQDVDGQVKWAMSKEEYSMPPAAGAEVGATIVISTKLSLKGTAAGAAPPAGIEKEKSINLGVHEHSGENQVKKAGELVKKICEGSQSGVGENNANQYAYLTYILSRSNKATMTNLFNQVKQGQICSDVETAKKILLDAIFDSQSSDGVQAMTELLKNKEVTGLKAKIWYASLGNVKHATVSTLKAVAGSMDGDAPMEAYLGAGSLLGRYCHTHPCDNVPEVNQLQKKIATPLNSGCKAASLSEEDKLMASIKGVGNSGYLGGQVTNKLIQCASDHTVRSRVRAAALDALRADPNKENIKKTAIAILKDINEDSELRIKSYLIVAECPCSKMAGIIKEVLDEEVSFQVGNFIVSHLRNIRASKNPDKAKAQKHFSGILAPKSYPFDIRKYSTNTETSYMLDSLNFGGSAEANIIYSQKSWIPRSVSLNLTSQIFGTSFNLLEMDVRAENLERMLERLVGPKGYLNGEPDEIVSDAKFMYGKFMGRAKQTFRPKRGASQGDIDNLANQVNMGVDAEEKDETLDLSLKLFGSEVAWMPLHGDQLDNPPKSVDSAFSLLDSIIDKAKNIDFDYTKHKVLAEGVVAYPTAMGVPIKMKGVISAAIRVQMDGKLDIPAIIRDPKIALVKFQIIPSGAVTGSMICMMEAGGLNTGVKVSVTAHSSTGSDVTLRLLEGKGIDVKVGLPLAKQDVITIKSDIVSFSDTPQSKNVKPVVFNVKREEYSGCFDQVSEIMGLTFCANVETPWEGTRIISPAYGPTSLSVRIEKDDPSLTNFHFKAYFNVQSEAPQHLLEIILDTPNSKKERRLGLIIENTISPHLAIKASVESPFGGAKLDASTINSPAEKSLNAELTLSDQEIYLFKAGIKQAGSNKYQPFLDYKAPEKAKSRFSELSQTKQGQQQVSVSGDIIVKDNKMTFEGLKLVISRQEYILDGSVWGEEAKSGVDLKVTYADDVLSVKAMDETTAPNHNKRTLQIASQKYPDMSVSATWDLAITNDKKQCVVSSDIVVVHGPDPNSETARITLSNSYDAQYYSKRILTKVNSKNLVLYPIVNLKGKLDFHGDPNSFGYDVEGTFETYNLGSSLDVQAKSQYSVDFTGKMMDHSVAMHTKRERVGTDKTKFTNSLELTPGGKYQLNSLVTHKIKSDDVDAFIDVKITLPSEPKNIEVKAGVKNNHEVHNGVLWASVDGKNLVDGKVDIAKGKTPAGNFKLVLPEYVDSHGEFKVTANGVDGNAVINLIKANKKIEGKTHVTMNNPNIKGTADLCLDSKCIKLAHESTIEKASFDTKNKLELPAGLVINVNGKHDEASGTTSADAEIKANNGKHTKVSYSSTRHIKPGDTEVEYIAGIEDWAKAGAKPRRMEAKLVGKHIDLDKQTGDGQIILTYNTPDGKDLSLHTNFKRVPAGEDRWTHNAEVGMTGSAIESPLNLKFESEAQEKFISGDFNQDGSVPPANYHLTLSVGNDLQVESHGKVAGHTLNNEINMKFPKAVEGIKHFKWSTNNVLDLVPREGARSKLKTSNTIKWDDKFVKSNLEINDADNGANFNMDLEGDTTPKRTLTGSAHFCKPDEGEKCLSGGSVAVTWEGKKADLSYVSEFDKSMTNGQVHLTGTLPDGTQFDIHTKGKSNKKGPEDISLFGETVMTIGDKKLAGSASLEVAKDIYHVDMILDHPEGRSQFMNKHTRKGNMHWLSAYIMKWTSNGGGSMIGDSEINFENENSFSIVSNVDSAPMHLDKFHFGAKVTPDKQLNVIIKNAGKELATAKASYQYSVDGTKRKVEGSGSMKIDGKEYPLQYDATLDGIQGMGSILQMSMNGKAGDREFKFTSGGTPTDFQMKRTYCKAAGDCSDAEISYQNKNTGPLSNEQNVVYKMDFSMFNPKMKNLLITSKTKREGLIFDQNVDIEWGPETSLKYVSYLHSNKAGASLTLPQRTVAAEASYGLPKKDKNAVKLEASVWLDKAKAPNKRTHLLILGEVGQNKDICIVSGEARFNNPALSKPLLIKGKSMISTTLTKPAGEGSFEIDVFKKPQMKIAGNWKLAGKKSDEGLVDAGMVANLKSEGLKLNINFDSKLTTTKDSLSWIEKLAYTNAKGEVKQITAKYEITPKKIHILMKLPEITMFDYLSKWEITDDSINIHEVVSLFDAKYQDSFEAKLHPPQFTSKLITNNGCDNKVLTIGGIFEMGKAAKIELDFDGKTFLSGQISLAESDFLRPEGKHDNDVFNAIQQCLEKNEEYEQEKIQEAVYKIGPHVEEEIKMRNTMINEAVPDMEAVASFYRAELDKIQEEILSDKTLQGTIQLIKESLSTVIEQVVTVMEEIHNMYVASVKEVTKAIEAISLTIKELVPKITKSFEDVMKAGSHLSDDLVHMAVNMSDLILQEIEAHSEEIGALIKSVADITEDYGKVIAKFTHQFNKDCQEFAETALATLKQLGEMISEQLETVKPIFLSSEGGLDMGIVTQLSDGALSVLDDLLTQLKESKSSPELQELIETLSTWVKKLLDKEPINNMEFAKKVSKELYVVVKMIASLVNEQLSANEEALGKSKMTGLTTLPSLSLTRVPPGLLRLSGLSWITSSDLPSLIQVISTYWPSTNPDDWMPPFIARAYLLGGSEVITFDGSHLSVEGDCSYVLTQDYMDGNFSVIAQFKGGKLDAIQVTEGKDVVELRHDKKPLVNGKESEFPIFQGQISTWKRSSVVGLSTKSGLKILCTTDCLRCKFKLSGFYFGKVRGILGTYDYEEFDDLTLPSGKIAESPEKFLSAWSLGGGCSAKSPKPTSKEATCTKTFSSAPDYLACYHLVSPKPYKEACYSLAAKETTPEGLQAAVCNVAFAYSLQCQTKIPTAVPSSCLKCTKENTNVFESFTTNEPPFKMADIVFTIERYETNQDVYETLVKPLVQSIKADLNAKGISDVKFGLVGFGGSKRMWPAYYTNDRAILSDDIETGNLVFDKKRSAAKKNEQFDDAVESLAAESGVTGKSTTYLDLVEYYPWRVGSAKAVIGIHATPCKESQALFMFQHLYYITSYNNKGISFHTFSPVKDLELPGQESKNILAIGDEEVFMMSDATKKPLSGDKAAEDQIKYKSDVCFTFAHMTGGNVFVADNYINGGAAEKEAFKKGITTSVVDSLTTNQNAQKCSCHPKMNPYDGIFSQADCRRVNI